MAALAAAFAPAAAASEPDSTSELWPEFDVFVRLNEKSRLFAMYSATKTENLGTYADGQTGLHIDFFGVKPLRRPLISYADTARSKALMVRAGYLFSRPKNNSGSATEHIATAEATGRAHLPAEWLLSDRNRLDLRWVDGAPRHRYRNRLKLERTFKVSRFDFTPYAHAELFYDLRQLEWSRFRYAAGAEWALTKRIVLEGYFLRQNAWAAQPQFVNATGLAVQFYFR